MVCIVIKFETEEPVDEDEVRALAEKASTGVGHANTVWWIVASDEESEIESIVENVVYNI